MRQITNEIQITIDGSSVGFRLTKLDAFVRRRPAPAAAAPVVNQNNNQTVEAPVSISVTATGTDPEAVGRSIYDVAERYLLRTLQAL